MSEIWTATEKIECERDGKPMIVFQVLDEDTGKTREERRYEAALPLMLATGGYPGQMGLLLAMQELPWRFRKAGGAIFLDGPSVGVPGHDPIDKELPRSARREIE